MSLLQNIAAIIDPPAMKTIDELRAEWAQWMVDNKPPNGWMQIDPEKHAEACALDEFDGLATVRARAMRKAGQVLELIVVSPGDMLNECVAELGDGPFTVQRDAEGAWHVRLVADAQEG